MSEGSTSWRPGDTKRTRLLPSSTTVWLPCAASVTKSCVWAALPLFFKRALANSTGSGSSLLPVGYKWCYVHMDQILQFSIRMKPSPHAAVLDHPRSKIFNGSIIWVRIWHRKINREDGQLSHLLECLALARKTRFDALEYTVWRSWPSCFWFDDTIQGVYFQDVSKIAISSPSLHPE